MKNVHHMYSVGREIAQRKDLPNVEWRFMVAIDDK